MNYKKYTRKFVLLKDGNGVGGDSEKEAKGYLRIETGNNKGAIRCQVENLKFYMGEKCTYKLMLLGEKKEKLISAVLGTIAINATGKGEGYFRFLPYDINGKGDELNDFSNIAIVTQEFKAVLKGELNGEEQRKSLSAENLRKNEPQKNYNDFYNKFLLNACTFLCQTADNFQDIVPFEKDKINAAWKRIGVVSNLPLIAPGAHYFASKYKHYIFGAKKTTDENILDYYIGIPGKDIKEEQPDGGESGFVYWQPIKGEKNGYGYWIVKISGENGFITSV